MTKILCFILLWGATAVAVLAQDSWTGLWRVSRYYQDRLDGSYHLFLKDDGEGGLTLTAYTDDARPMILQELKTDGRTIEVQVANSAKQPLPLRFTLTREGDKVQGEWVFSQMQLMTPVTGQAAGFRITASDDWSPWPFLPALQATDQTSIDLAGLVIAKAPRDDFDKFVEFWDREIESKYYFIVQQSLYGAARTRTRRLEVLKPFFEHLKKTPETTDLLGKFPEIAARVDRTVQIRTINPSKAYLVNWPMLQDADKSHELLLWTRVPTPRDEAACACTLDLRERFLLTDGLKFAAYGEAAVPRWEEAIIEETLWIRPAPSVGVALFRRGLTRMLATQGQASADEVSLDQDQRAEMKAKVKALLFQPLPGSPALLQKQTAGLLELGVEFARDLVSQFTLGEVLRRDDLEIVQDWQEFLGLPRSPTPSRRP